MDEGYGTPDEDKTASLTPAKMTVNAIKDWLTENGHENIVWDLTQAKAKKPRYYLRYTAVADLVWNALSDGLVEHFEKDEQQRDVFLCI